MLVGGLAGEPSTEALAAVEAPDGVAAPDDNGLH